MIAVTFWCEQNMYMLDAGTKTVGPGCLSGLLAHSI